MKKTRDRAPRLSFEDRHNHILKHAAALIIKRGIAGFTLEDVAEDAKISKALVYKHFANREALIKVLAEREFRALRGQGIADLPKGIAFEDALRMSNDRIFRYLDDRGAILRAMLGDREVARMLGSEDGDARKETTEFFVDTARRAYGLSPEAALICGLLMVNAPFGAARALRRHKVDPLRASEVWSTFLLGGWAAVTGAARPSSSRTAREALPRGRHARAGGAVNRRSARE